MAAELHINSKEITNSSSRTIFELASQSSINIPTSCTKLGKCKECIIEVKQGHELLSEPTSFESHLTDNFRLACQCHIKAKEGIVKCNTLQRGSLKIETGASKKSFLNHLNSLNPAITRIEHDVFLEGKKIATVENSKNIYGLAIDLGTTTIVVRLIDLETGQLIITRSFENPQRFGGSDVMSRIQYETDNKGKILQRVLLKYLAAEIEKLPASGNQIFEIIIAGNSTMRDMFFGINVYSIGQMPYRSLTENELNEGKRKYTDVETTAKKLDLPIHPKASVYGLPLISGHVGADTAACLLAIDIFNEKNTIVLMDIGTNTEIIIGDKNRLIAASCPAGPAFEGGGIDCGVPGLDGAIERISIDSNQKINTQIIGKTTPIGICGSGLIDAMAELLKNDFMNIYGRFEDPGPFILNNEHDIYISEKDINELAQAKGANIAGFNIALKKYGKPLEKVKTFYLAGGFGRHINIENAQQIGFLPSISKNKTNQIGNATIEGASIALLSISKRKKLREFVKEIEHVKLESDPNFFDYFVEGCQFKRISVELENEI